MNLVGLHESAVYFRFLRSLPEDIGWAIEDAMIDVRQGEGLGHGLVGQFFKDLGMKEEAKRHYALALGVLPDEPAFLMSLGNLRFSDGDLDGGLSLWRRAVQIDPSQTGLFHYNVACFFAHQGNAELVAQHLRLAMDSGFGNVEWLRTEPAFGQVLSHPKVSLVVREIERSQEP